MKKSLIIESIMLVRSRLAWRLWCMSIRPNKSNYHRVDGGPAVERLHTGYCAWWERGVFVRDDYN